MDAPLRITGADAARVRRVRGREPEEFYPAVARRELLDGQVIVELLINEDGAVVEATVVAEVPPDKGFALAALDVVKTWEFDNPLRRLVLMEVGVAFAP